MMRALENAVWVCLCVIALSAPTARAQQSRPSQQPGQQSNDQSSGPIPAYRSPLASAADNSDNVDESQELTPDTRSLSGAQYLSLGIPTTRSYWQPSVDVNSTADSNALDTAQTAGWGAWTVVSGGINVHRTSGTNEMTLSYASGGLFSSYTGVSSGISQELGFADTFAFRHLQLSFFDDFHYLPQSLFGYQGLVGNLTPAGTSSVLSDTFTPGQLLLGGYDRNLQNSFATELDTGLTPRTSLTFVGAYSQLHYFGSDLLNYGTLIFRGGYSYQMTRKDTIALIYTFSGIRYNNFNQSIDGHTVQASYARRVTGRLAFQVAAGPEVVISRIPVSGNAGSVGGGSVPGTNSTQLFWSLTTALRWQPNRTALGLTYYHGVGGGVGLLAGAVADNVMGNVTRQVSRTFSNGITAGYTRNTGTAITGSTPANQSYGYWFAGANLAHPMGQTLALTFSYQMQYQTSNATFCIGPTCGTNVIRHMISLGVGWHDRPLLF